MGDHPADAERSTADEERPGGDEPRPPAASASAAEQQTERRPRLARAAGYRWIDVPAPTLTPAHEDVFLTMRLRKWDRQEHGPRKKEGLCHLLLLAVLLVLVLSTARQEGQAGNVVALTYEEIAIVAAWLFAVALVASLLKQSPHKTLLFWMVIYLPLLALFVSLIAYGTAVRDQPWLGWTLLAFELAALSFFLVFVVLYPRLIRSRWLRDNLGIGRWWSLRLVSDWTMVYRGRSGMCRRGQTCKYEGETAGAGGEGTDLPHGWGRWLDDSYMGEILSGRWRDGMPVAPFRGRVYGTGDAFAAVRIGYFSGTDDGFATTKFHPSNDTPPRVGVTSVECSLEGNFYSHLPRAAELFGPQFVGDGGAAVPGDDADGSTGTGEGEGEGEGAESSGISSVEEMLCRLIHLDDGPYGTGGGRPGRLLATRVTVDADDPRGVQVRGHAYGPTGVPFSGEPDQIVVDVRRSEGGEGGSAGSAAGGENRGNFMPRLHLDGARERMFLPSPRRKSGAHGSIMVRVPEEEMGALLEGHARDDAGEEIRESKPRIIAGLDVRNWTRQSKRGALVFFPGYNCPLKYASEAFGQFMAMTNLSAHVYPIIYAWPCSVVVNPRAASAAAATERNRENVLELIRGLSAAGIQDVHFLSHSMGVQTLLGIFEDKEDGSCSNASSFFRADPAFGDDSAQQGSDGQLICKTITMVNPDFPLDAFCDKAFLTIRRVCNHITVVGDREDVALQYLSKGGNWLFNRMGSQQPRLLTPRGKSNSQRGIYRVLGCDFDRLHYPDDEKGALSQDLEGGEKVSLEKNDALLFTDFPSLVLSTDENVKDRKWFDLDAIDVTSLDTNIAGIRHGGFNLNPILLKDLEELIRFGRRASKRSNLIYREGNIYSYCHAPSHVAM